MPEATIEYDDMLDDLAEETTEAVTDFVVTKKPGETAKKTENQNLKQVSNNADDIATNSALLAGISTTSVAKTADYTILDDDGFGVIKMTVGSSTDKTATLPTVADNIDREITLYKVDAGTKNAILVGEASEFTAVNLPSLGNWLKVKADEDSATWIIIDGNITFDTGWVLLGSWLAATVTLTHNLGVYTPYLDCEIHTSASGADGTDNKIVSIAMVDAAPAYAGQVVIGNSINAVTLQIGVNGAITLGPTGFTGVISSGYYRVIFKRKL